MSKKLTIGIFGLGTVGTGVYQILQKQKSHFKHRYGMEYDVKRIVVKNIAKRRGMKLPPRMISTKAESILNDGDIDVVFELIGGLEPARGIVKKALENGKHVITANKAILAKSGKEIFSLAEKKRKFLGFRASITGCHDIVEHLGLSGGIQGVYGILNGTCNYILTEMESKKKNFPDILRAAQQKGYAEANPSLDVDGFDTADKLLIVTSMIFGAFLTRKNISVEGIRHLTLEDIEFAKELGYRIKLLGISRLVDGKLDCRVHPCLVPAASIMGTLRGVENGVTVDDTLRGMSAFTALGAGQNPSASAAVSDFIALGTGMLPCFPKRAQKLPLVKPQDVVSAFYLRFTAPNQPGVLAKISAALAKNNINIVSVLQKGQTDHRGAPLPLIIVVDKARQGNVQKALLQVNKNAKPFSRSCMVLPIEENVL